jgi:nitrate/nitrite-specific signal transduction histidine kinase
LFSLLLARAVVRPLEGMSAAAQRIAEQGRRDAVEGAERSDEIGVLARSFNAMTERLTAVNAELRGRCARATSSSRSRRTS